MNGGQAVEQQEFYTIRELFDCNRRKRPERLLFAGSSVGAHGIFEPYLDLSGETCADFLCGPETSVPVTVRFSRMCGGHESADTVRDLRGFSVRFHTEDGAFDLLSIHLPEFYLSSTRRFPELVRAMLPDSQTGLRTAERFWTFFSDCPESLPCLLLLFTDRGTLKSYRTMEGYSIDAHVLTGGKKRTDTKIFFSWKPESGVRTIHRREAECLAGFDPEAARRDLVEAISEGKEPTWHLWMRGPCTEACCLGRMRLNRLPEQYEEEIEGLDFSPMHLVPGILPGSERQKLMALVCEDAQRYRLGGGNYKKTEYRSGADHQSAETGEGSSAADGYVRAAAYYRGMSPAEQETLIGNLGEELLFLPEKLQFQLLKQFQKIDEVFAFRMKQQLC